MIAQRFPVWATLFTLCGVFVLCGLGSWQIKRLHWKQDILTKIESARAEKSYPALNGMQLNRDGLAWTPAKLQGYFGKKSFYISPRTYEGKVGFHILSPLILEDGSAILVNRGWAPGNQRGKLGRTGTVIVSGLLRPVQKPNMFVPKNIPEKDEWYSVDMAEMAKAANLQNLPPYILYAESETGDPEYPVRAALEANPANNHLSYAIFWFAMAGVLVVIYTLRFYKKYN